MGVQQPVPPDSRAPERLPQAAWGPQASILQTLCTELLPKGPSSVPPKSSGLSHVICPTQRVPSCTTTVPSSTCDKLSRRSLLRAYYICFFNTLTC